MKLKAACVTCQQPTIHEIRWSNPQRERKFAACTICGTTQPYEN